MKLGIVRTVKNGLSIFIIDNKKINRFLSRYASHACSFLYEEWRNLMLKIAKKTQKIIVMLIIIITLFATIQPVVLGANQTISGSGNDKFIARQYATRIKTTDAANGGENGIVARRLLMKNQGWNFGNGDRNPSFLCTESEYILKQERLMMVIIMYQQQQN